MAQVNVRVLPAGAGLAWLRGALRLFGRQALPLLVLILLGPLIFLSLLLVPWVGQALCQLLFPGILLGMLTVCRAVELGALPGISCYGAGLRTPTLRLRLLQIGVVSALASVLIGQLWNLAPDAPAPATPTQAVAPAASAPAAGDTVPGASQPQPAPATRPDGEEDSVLAHPTPAQLLVAAVSFVLAVPLQVVVLLATALVGWHDMSTPKALFFGLFAGWRNRAAIVVNLFALLGLGFLTLMAVVAVGMLVGLAEGSIQIVLMPVMLLLMAIAVASSYRMVRDILDEPPGA
jgi:hypothetical protein